MGCASTPAANPVVRVQARQPAVAVHPVDLIVSTRRWQAKVGAGFPLCTLSTGDSSVLEFRVDVCFRLAEPALASFSQ